MAAASPSDVEGMVTAFYRRSLSPAASGPYVADDDDDDVIPSVAAWDSGAAPLLGAADGQAASPVTRAAVGAARGYSTFSPSPTARRIDLAPPPSPPRQHRPPHVRDAHVAVAELAARAAAVPIAPMDAMPLRSPPPPHAIAATDTLRDAADLPTPAVAWPFAAVSLVQVALGGVVWGVAVTVGSAAASAALRRLSSR
jgi:hypothetical protein